VGLGLAVFGNPSPRVGLNMVRAGQQEHSFERALQHYTEKLFVLLANRSSELV
jgi:hypothetical protein